jgi:branched-chain amino acid transport system permease protein
MLLLQLMINGLQVGALYALTAVGFSLIFGSTKVFHFAHGSTFTIAAYVFYWLYTIANLHWTLATLAAAACAVAFGVFMDRCVYVPIKRHEGSYFTVFVASFGAAIIVQNAVGMAFGRSFISVSTPLSASLQLMPGLYVSPLSVIAIVCAVVFFVALQVFLMRTNVGVALRALSENPELVRVFGMNPRWLSTAVFALGSLLAVPAAVLTSASAGLNPAIGHHVMLISMAATIVGGVGSLRGAACAGLLLGMAENLALLWCPPQWTDAVSFIVLFFFIIFRPTGFFGRPVAS